MIVCFGDSITYGQGLDDPSRDAFPALLSEQLRVPVANRGYCGDTTRVALERFGRDVQESACRVVVIQFGHNDCNVWGSDRGHPRVSMAAFVANLGEMAERASRFYIQVVYLAPHTTALGEEYEARRRLYARAMSSYAHENQVAYPSQVDLLDHIHPSVCGHKQLADSLAPLVGDRL